MRTHLSLLLLGTACMGMATVQAQNWVNGGNTMAANGTLGTNSSHSLIFETSGLDRGRITNGGNWAIGSTGTASKLTVNSASNVSPFRAQVVGVTKLLVNGNGSTSIGSTTAGPTNGLYVVGSVGIGTAVPTYKLHVEGTIYGKSTNPNAGVFGYSSYSTGTGVQGQSSYIGVYGYAGGYGLYGVAYNTSGYGVYGINNSGSTSSGIGVHGQSSWIGVNGTGNLFGIRGNVSGASAYGVGGLSTNSIGVYGYTGNTSSWAGYFAGRVHSSGGYSSSDRKLKEEIVDVNNALDIINQLKPKSYKFRQDGNYKLMNLPQGQHYGLIAQDVEKVLPNMVAEAEFNTARIPQNGEGAVQQKEGEIISFKAMNYTELIPILVKGMQEQQQVIEKQQLEIGLQQQRIEKLEQLVSKLSFGQGFNTFLSSAQLGEVSPNPVKGAASIQYAIPEGSTRALLFITDALGRSIRQITLSKSGVINVDVSDLASGVYNYSLIVDNKTIDTKKMTVVR